jgi:hypothetical protein
MAVVLMSMSAIDEAALRIYGGHMIRVPCSPEEVLGWFG